MVFGFQHRPHNQSGKETPSKTAYQRPEDRIPAWQLISQHWNSIYLSVITAVITEPEE
jgi:hypothetical protein